MVPVVYVFACFLGGLAVALVLPAMIAARVGENELVPDFLISSALLIFLAGALMFSLRGRERRLQPAQRYLLAVFLWALLPLFAAMPLLSAVDGVSVLDAYFEMVSALTTTGASVLPPPERLPRTIVFWVALIQWLGGGLTLLAILLVLAPTRAGGLPEAHARLVEHGGLAEKGRLVLVLRDIMPIYAAATVLCFTLLMGSGLPPLDALCLSFAGVSTGGFAPRSTNLGEYVSSTGILVLMLFMLYGATSLLWHRDLISGRWTKALHQQESWWVIAICLCFGFLAALVFYIAAGQGAFIALRDGFFTVASIVTTTGLEVRKAGFEVLPLTLVIVLTALGAASFSTAGGVKFFRVGAMLAQAGGELNRLVYPHGVRPTKVGSRSYDIQAMKAIWSGFLVFVAALILLSWILAAHGVPYEGALLAAISALSNAGPIYASEWEAGVAWPAYAEMGAGARLALCAAMVLGRLEVIAVLGLLVYVRRRGWIERRLSPEVS